MRYKTRAKLACIGCTATISDNKPPISCIWISISLLLMLNSPQISTGLIDVIHTVSTVFRRGNSNIGEWYINVTVSVEKTNSRLEHLWRTTLELKSSQISKYERTFHMLWVLTVFCTLDILGVIYESINNLTRIRHQNHSLS